MDFDKVETNLKVPGGVRRTFHSASFALQDFKTAQAKLASAIKQAYPVGAVVAYDKKGGKYKSATVRDYAVSGGSALAENLVLQTTDKEKKTLLLSAGQIKMRVIKWPVVDSSKSKEEEKKKS